MCSSRSRALTSSSNRLMSLSFIAQTSECSTIDVRAPMDVITSRQHPIVKEFRDLARGAGPLMLLDGWHLLGEAAAARVAVEKIAICGPPTAQEQTIVDRLRRSGAQVVDVSGTVLNALSPVNSPTGVVASARIPSVDVGVGADAGAGARAGRRRAPGSRQRRRDHSLGRRRRRHRRRARRAVRGSVGLEGAARIDGQRVSSAGRAQPRPCRR